MMLEVMKDKVDGNQFLVSIEMKLSLWDKMTNPGFIKNVTLRGSGLIWRDIISGEIIEDKRIIHKVLTQVTAYRLRNSQYEVRGYGVEPDSVKLIREIGVLIHG